MLTYPHPHRPEEAFVWEDPPSGFVETDFTRRWFPKDYRDLLTGLPGQWGRIATSAGNHVHPALRREFPDFEFKARRNPPTDDPQPRGPVRTYTIYARRRPEETS